MKIFYSCYSRSEDVPSNAPIEADLAAATDVLWNIEHKGSFIGIELEEPFVFQVMNEEHFFYSELLDKDSLEIKFADLDIEIVEKLFDAIFANHDFFKASERLGIEWKSGSLK